MAPLLEVDDLRVEFGRGRETASVLNGVSYHVDEGETLAVLGESGSGKSVTAQTVMGILDTPPGRITGGSVRFRGEELLGADPERRRLLRGESMAMIFQDALSALNPVYSVGFQIAEQFRFRRGMSRKDAMVKAAEMLDLVKIPNAKQRVKEYPHQFSGGMRQRAMIAMSLALDPELLIADEPTTALDVTVQAQIMELLDELRRERGMGLILITHDLGVVAEVADRIAVMYAGRIVEHTDAASLYAHPAHPYTRGLMDSVPRVDDVAGAPLRPIPGLPPSLSAIPDGCPFHPRCAHAVDVCTDEVPALRELGSGHQAACHFAERFVAEGPDRPTTHEVVSR
ncbi:oligopeptide transport system ATP-binding protein [Actinomycetospora succinea]|uniref:Oligopeptide transport system ATP-binding protein n=1 Tax=Actinomycetospora succinea TaxID=663603 RepID=A0A4R6V9A7_9PSEU|nr:ABC transporter ATP-binding protein [Actinomycetospora succinea]TDQ58437.1 oligopeptide transport system ATP-binding protein [Actinomycetospora succinea]